jgi:hypothetical protein
MAGAKDRYTQLKTIRQPFLDRARECAKLTIPTMMPPEGSTGYTKLPTPWQGLGARCINFLSARITLALFPPSATFFKLTIDDFALERLTKQKGMRGEVEKALNRMERATCSELETSAMRPALNEALKHLINAGNVLVFVPDDGALRLYRLDRYVVKRDPMGHVLEIITHECISPLELSDEVTAAVKVPPPPKGKKSTDDYLSLYTHIQRTKAGWSVYQDLEDQVVPGSRGTYTKDKSPWLALRLTALDNEDYGRGLTEEYLGDFKTLEALTKAVTQGAAAAAKVLFLVKPNGTTKPTVISQAESGAVREGNAEDVTVLQLDKAADFKVAFDLRSSIREDLAYAFLLNSAIQRNGERVTAEEIRYMAQELETGLGGIYSNLSTEFQLPLVRLLMDRLEKAGRLPPLPRKYVKPEITTGLDAIGRGNDRTRLSQFLTDVQSVDAKPGSVLARYIVGGELVKRLGVGAGIDMDGLVKTDDMIAQEDQQAQLMALVQKLGPNAINKIGDYVKQQQASGAVQPTPQ